MTAPHPEPRQVLYEFTEIGNSVRLAAVDPATMVEVVVVGPRHAFEMLKRTACRKLASAIARHRAAEAASRR